MNIAFVTCIFNGLHDTPYGGRNREEMYKQSLMSISKIDVPIFCFTFPNEVNNLSDFFNQNKIHNVIVEPFDLFGQDYHHGIMLIKQKYPQIYDMTDHLWKNRCPEIMWGKTRMIKKVIDRQDNIDYIFWIDAGLSNCSIFPKKYFPNIELGQEYFSEKIFTPTLVQNIINSGAGKIFAMIHDWPNNSPIPEIYNKSAYTIPYGSMIAGIFGGNTQNMSYFCDEFEEYIYKMIQYEEIYPEESAYTGIMNDNQHMFDCHWFKTFYHEDWKGFKYYQPGQRSFSDVLEELANLKQK